MLGAKLEYACPLNSNNDAWKHDIIRKLFILEIFTFQILYLSGCSITNPNVFFFSLSLQEVSVSNGPEAQSVPKEEEQEEQGEGSEDEWEQVGPRNKSSVTRQADFVQTPITDIFGGHIRYSTFSYKFLTFCGWIFWKMFSINRLFWDSKPCEKGVWNIYALDVV